MSQSKPTPLVVHGWTIFAHPLFLDQLEALIRQADALEQKDPVGYIKKNVSKRLAAIAKLAFDVIPQDPTKPEYRQGNTLGDDHKHCFPAIPSVLSVPRTQQGDRVGLGERRGHQTRLREQ